MCFQRSSHDTVSCDELPDYVDSPNSVHLERKTNLSSKCADFKDLLLKQELIEALCECGYSKMMPG